MTPSEKTIPIRASAPRLPPVTFSRRSEEHTSELQSQSNLVCRLLLEKKKLLLLCRARGGGAGVGQSIDVHVGRGRRPAALDLLLCLVTAVARALASQPISLCLLR